MAKTSITLINKLGLHARAAAKFVSTATAYGSDIRVSANGQTVDGKSIMSVMMLAASCGTELQLECTGHDAELALSGIVDLIERRFDEPE